MTAPGKPLGSVPILSLENAHFIKQSIAILEYFEDICDEAQSSGKTIFSKHVAGSMRGRTTEEKARVREMLAIADEANTYFGVACHKGTALFAIIESQNPAASAIAMGFCMKSLTLLELYYKNDHRFDGKDLVGETNATIVDCVLFSLLQFAREFYGRDLVADLPHLRRFYNAFEKRESAKIGEDFYSSEMKPLAREWLAES
jgi:glutathione S-transferase